MRDALGDAFEVRAADLPGHGTRRTEAFDLARAIAELADAARDEARQRPVLLAGDSLGGYLALAVAAAVPGVAGVIAGSCTYPMRGAPALLARLSLAVDVPAAEWPFRALTRLVTSRATCEAIVARGFAPRMRNVTLRALLDRDVVAEIRAIDAPIVFVDGAFDVPIVWFARTMANAGRRARVVIVPKAGHGVGLTHPLAFADAVRSCFRAGQAHRRS